MTEPLDTELTELPAEARWRVWMGRVEAVLFASAVPVPRAALAQVVGQGVSVEMLIDDIGAELQSRPYQIMPVAGGWVMRTRPVFATAITRAGQGVEPGVSLTDFEGAVLAAIAYHQPITRAGLAEIFGKEISRDLIARLRQQGVIAAGPRSPQRGAPLTFVTTAQFLLAFGMESLRDLPDRALLEDAGLAPRQSQP